MKLRAGPGYDGSWFRYRENQKLNQVGYYYTWVSVRGLFVWFSCNLEVEGNAGMLHLTKLGTTCTRLSPNCLGITSASIPLKSNE